MKNEFKTGKNYSSNNDPKGDLRIENEIVKLKMHTETASIVSRDTEEFLPESDVQFLGNVHRYEAAHDSGSLIPIYEYIGEPAFITADAISEENVKSELQQLLGLLHANNITLEVLEDYDPFLIYKFITEELFFEKLADGNRPDYIHGFVYEEFHPNHKVDIEKTTQLFVNHWLERKFSKDCAEFADHLITPDKKTFDKINVIENLTQSLDCYKSFTNIKFKGPEVHFNWNETENKGLGHAEGFFKYDAETESKYIISIEGPYKLYMSNEDGHWKIFYFVFPGFEWP